MVKYLLRRTLLALPTLVVISLFAFWLGKSAPGDPVINVFGEELYATLDPEEQAAKYRVNAVRLGIDRPDFYFSLSTAAYPDTLWRIFPLDRRARLEKLLGQTGNWTAVKNFDAATSEVVRAIESQPNSIPVVAKLKSAVAALLVADRLDQVDAATKHLKELTFDPDAWPSITTTNTKPWPPIPASLTTALSRLITSVSALREDKTLEQLRVPALHWHGFDNQYHRWVSGFVTGDLGLTRRKISVWDDLQASLLTTLTINVLAIFLAYLLAVPLGVEMARRKGKWLDRWGKRALFFVYSMPVFWLGGLLIMLFMNTDWGQAALPSLYFDIQDAWLPGKTSFGEWWSNNASKCVLPIVILTLHATTVLALQMRSGMLGTLGEDYIRTARAKGVGEEEVHWSHAFRNALFPIITVFASVLPAVFTGSLVVEAMFGFPGMGNKTFEAYLGKDLPLLSAIMMASATLAIVGNLLADVMYAWADPRVRFAKKNG